MKNEIKMRTCYICKGKFEDKHAKDQKYCKVRDYFHYAKKYRSPAISICNSKGRLPKEILWFFTMNLTIIFNFIINKSVEKFQRQFTCLKENTEKYITFSAPIEKKVSRMKRNPKNYILNIIIY